MSGPAELRRAEKKNREHHQDWKAKTIYQESDTCKQAGPENQEQQQEIQHRVGRGATSPVVYVAQFMQRALAGRPVGDEKNKHHNQHETMAGMQRLRVVRCRLGSIAWTEARDVPAEEAVVPTLASWQR